MKTEEQYQEKIIELEQAYEDLEQTYFLSASVLVGIILHLYWGNWIITIALPIAGYFIAWKLFAKKPFTKNVSKNIDAS